MFEEQIYNCDWSLGVAGDASQRTGHWCTPDIVQMNFAIYVQFVQGKKSLPKMMCAKQKYVNNMISKFANLKVSL